jgi:hypothetical protein
MSVARVVTLVDIGLLLAVLVFPVVFFLSATFGYVLYSISKAIEKIAETKHIPGVIGQAVSVGSWEITVVDVKEARYLNSGDSYYAAKEGQKAVMVTLRIRNIGEETMAPNIWSFIIVTNANKIYESKPVYNFESLWSWNITEEVKTSAVTVNTLNTFASIAPETQVEGDILFEIPQTEEPQKLHFKVGFIGATKVMVTLS